MAAFLILIIITLVFSITIGLIIMNRDSVPDVLVEEAKNDLEERKKELEEDDKINQDIVNNNIEVVITKDEEKQVDDEEII